MPLTVNNVVETSQTTGTGTLDLDGAAAGFLDFGSQLANGETVAYRIDSGDDWEIGIGTWLDGAPDQLQRVTVLESSNAGSAVSLTQASTVQGVAVAEMLTAKTRAVSGNTTLTLTDHGRLIVVNASGGAVTITLPDVTAATAAYRVSVKKVDDSANAVTIQRAGSATIDGETTLVLPGQWDTAVLACDGTNWRVIGLTGGVAGLSFASEAEAEAGTAGDKLMTPQRVTNHATVRTGLSIAEFGAVGDDSTDNAAAIQAAIDAAEAAGGGIVRIPLGVYRVGTPLVIDDNSVVLQGMGMARGNRGSTLRFTFTTGDAITIAEQHCGIKDLHIDYDLASPPTDGFAVAITQPSFQCFVENVRFDGVYNGILITGSTETRIYRVSMRNIFGPLGVLYTGSSANRSFRCVIDDFLGDNPYPHGDPNASNSKGAWSSSTSYSVGDSVLNNNRIYQCKSGGTSAGSGGPTGTGSDISDGSVVWSFVSFQGTWIAQDNFAYSLVINKAACISNHRGFLMTDSANTGDSFPVWAFIWNLECDHNYHQAVDLERGEGVYINGSWLGSCLRGHGVFISANFKGETRIGGGTRIMGNAQDGVLINGLGPTDTLIQGCFIGDNGQQSANSFDGVKVGANAILFQITDNKIGDLVGGGGGVQRRGITINSGTSDLYIVTNNMLVGNATGGISDGGSGSDKIVTANVG